MLRLPHGFLFIATIILAGCASSGLVSAVSASSNDATEAHPSPDEIGMLLDADVVVVGTIADARTHFRALQGGCGLGGQGMQLRDFDLVVEKVLAGTVLSDTLPCSVLITPSAYVDDLVPGSRVLLWGFRDPDDAGRLWAVHRPIGRAGRITWFVRRTADPRDTLAGVEAALARRREQTVDGGLIDFEAVGVVVVRDIEVSIDRHFRCKCEPVGMLFGAASQLPTVLDVEQPGSCLRTVARGDSLAVTIKRPLSPEATMSMTYCPRAFLVTCSFIPAFARRTDDIAAAIVMDGARASIKRIQNAR